MILLNISVLAFVALVGWWLTGYDSNLAGDGRRSDAWRRILRILFSLFLMTGMLMVPPLTIPFLVFLGVTWAGCISEFLSHWIRRVVDPSVNDNRPFDASKARRYMDTIAHLIQNGRRDEAIRLCEELKLSGEVELATLETTLEFLGVKQEKPVAQAPLKVAAQLRSQGKFAEAELLLKSLLAQKPADVEAAMLLIRVYAQDLRQPDRAQEVLRALQKQTHIAASHIDFARRSIDEWSQAKPSAIEPFVETKAESVDEMLAQGFFGTAIERLEEGIMAQPQDFELRLKLVEIHAVHCKNFSGAEKIIRQMDAAVFSRSQLDSARAKLKGWREASKVRVA